MAFSRNLITGIDEIVVEAVRGSGVSLMQEGVTPQRWTHRWGQWQAKPERTDIDHTMISQVVEQTRHIAKAFQHPVDMEWVFDGHRIYWVQMREITSARRVRIYSNRIAKEMLPGLIKPLNWSVNVPLVTTCWAHILTELIGPYGIAPKSLLPYRLQRLHLEDARSLWSAVTCHRFGFPFGLHP